ncbi:MAG: TetR/AcrR family transcriptional regulator [Lautropia sp.]
MRSLLLDVAEEMFATHGIDAVSLNSIARKANQLNASVMQYHFASKAGVIEAILARRMEDINRRREELLDSIDPTVGKPALRQIAQAMVLPFAEHLKMEGGSRYLRFVAQVTFNADKSVFEIVRGKHDSAVRRIADLVLDIEGELPAELVRHRLAVVTNMVLFNIGEREKLRMSGRRTGVARIAADDFVADLVEMIVAALDAPRGGSAGLNG